MKAMVYREYGSADNLNLEEVEKPVPKNDELLVKIHSTSVNSWDWDLLTGKSRLVRLVGGGLSKPKKKILGCDISGTVEAVGNDISKFKVGDEVFGDVSAGNWGGFAEYTCAKEDELTLKPTSMTFEEAAALLQAGVMAMQGIRDHGKVKKGQQVLINGACGGVGTLAIQMAKNAGAEVTGVDNTNKLDRMKALGADHVIDYTKEDFTRNGVEYDFILDVVGFHSIYDYKRSLKKGGTYKMVGGPTGLIFQVLFIGTLISIFTSKKMSILAHEPNKDMEYLISLFETKTAVPIIDRSYPLAELPKAIQSLGEGRVQGKVVITL